MTRHDRALIATALLSALLASPRLFSDPRRVQMLPWPLLILVLVLVMLAAGCAAIKVPAVPPLVDHPAAQGTAGDCVRFFAALDETVRDAGVADRQARRIRGFPYLRVDRFLASFAGQPLAGPALSVWVDRLAALDREARKAEIANLPSEVRHRLAARAGEADLLAAIASCGDRLRETDLASPENLQQLLAQAKVPDDYLTANSVLGLYPITSLFVRRGIAKYHRQTKETFATGLADLPVTGRLIRYGPPVGAGLAPAEVATLIAQATANPLAIPEFSSEQLNMLFQTFAPIWEIDVNGDFDRPGAPQWADNPLPGVDAGQPQIYTLLSYARFHGEILPQLNYVIWFSERPWQGKFDLYGGRLDGLIWRVTLERHGMPLIYDTIHNCGCYHMFFPSGDLITQRPQSIFSEPILVPQKAPAFETGKRLVIRLASLTHFIERIYPDKRDAFRETVPYSFADYNELRSLPAGPASRRSLFGPDGLVPGTERAERWLLWPTGVASPGAMRQWGNHATAFFGRRHFNDPELLEVFSCSTPVGVH